MAFTNPLLYMVRGRQEDSTNGVQVIDTVSNNWRRPPNLTTRFTPMDMFCYCRELLLVVWQSARNNFIMCLDRETGEGKVVLEGMEGAWSRGTGERGFICALGRQMMSDN